MHIVGTKVSGLLDLTVPVHTNFRFFIGMYQCFRFFHSQTFLHTYQMLRLNSYAEFSTEVQCVVWAQWQRVTIKYLRVMGLFLNVQMANMSRLWTRKNSPSWSVFKISGPHCFRFPNDHTPSWLPVRIQWTFCISKACYHRRVYHGNKHKGSTLVSIGATFASILTKHLLPNFSYVST